MTSALESFPLAWPTGRTRTPEKQRKRARFGTGAVRQQLTIAAALGRLKDELRLVRATDVVISTNIPVRKDGLPYSRVAEPDDPGVAVYFRLAGAAHVLATDKWDRVADNIGAIAAHIDAMRGQSRWGVGDIQQAFAGYRALPAMNAKQPWWEILGFREQPDPEVVPVETIRSKWMALARRHHPDRGGNPNQAAEINAAWDEAAREYGYYIDDNDLAIDR